MGIEPAIAPLLKRKRLNMLADLPTTTPISLAEHPSTGGKSAWHERFEAWRTNLAELEGRDSPELVAQNALTDGLNRLCAFSPYLSQSLMQAADDGGDLLAKPLPESLEAALASAEQAVAATDDFDQASKHLRIAKNRAHLVIALGDFLELWDLTAITTALSHSADRLIQTAIRFLLRYHQAKLGIEAEHAERPELGSGLIVLGMGKLGAGELNYSSDIDLILFYDPAATKLDRFDAPVAYSRLARDLVTLLERRTADGYVFRTDLRLRPDPASTPLAVALPAAVTYYTSQALTWERAAMIKARPIIGDPGPVNHLMTMLRRWVWRAGSDLMALEDINAIKRKIDDNQARNSSDLNGFNVKLDPGGIRQIEFFAQAQQLLFAGQDPGLRIYRTLDALDRLVESGRLDAERRDQLTDAYHCLRQVEHRLQMREDQQTHSLPITDDGWVDLADSLATTPTNLKAELNQHLETVTTSYDSLFNANRTPNPGPKAIDNLAQRLTELGFDDGDRAASIVGRWQRGEIKATEAERARELLDASLDDLLQATAAMPEPDRVLNRLDDFLGQLSAGAPLFALLRNTVGLPALLAKVLGLAPAIADTLTRRPGLLESILEPGFLTQLPKRHQLELELQEQLSVSEGYEDSLDICRRWTARRRFQGALHLLNGASSHDRVAQMLAQLAELSLEALQPLVEAEFSRNHGHFQGGGLSIIAMGNLASGQLTLTSDLDLVLVYRVDPSRPESDGRRPLSPNEYWIKLASRLVTAITAPTAEGKLYDADLRLRPQGNAGPLAVSLESFAQYQSSDAWTWEHMALTRARVLTGDIDLRGKIDAILHRTLTAERDSSALKQDVADMRGRIAKQHGELSIWQLKYRRGGIIDIQFIAQYLMLLYAAQHPQILSGSTTAALTRLGEVGVLTPDVAEGLINAHRLFRRVRAHLRLITDDSGAFDPNQAPPAILEELARIILMEEVANAEQAAFDFQAAKTHLSAVIDRLPPNSTRSSAPNLASAGARQARIQIP
ncbi:MAG: bifunctional [glutamine synthetase] adenylyltransferase/[glutamine synthetase]-adenylyl-L-tyrosine phosphorylase [Alphaproteobacteria bacterium]|nr:bifunctional [glutamine synthetase] adenylyltransferase/[glutamine synthetase]-adenylyl-L-tyrosine phosphorylase [Alphaproteobacteria bacterium SS10]